MVWNEWISLIYPPPYVFPNLAEMEVVKREPAGDKVIILLPNQTFLH